MAKNIYLANILAITGFALVFTPMVASEAMIQMAHVSMSKIKGTVTFTQTTPSSPTHINFNLNGVSEELHVKIFSLPMIYEGGPQRSCRNAAIGTVYNPTDSATGDCSTTNQSKCAVGDLSGKIGSINQGNEKNNFTDHNLPLSGKYGIFSRTLVFLTTSGAAKACALIDRDFGPGRTAIAQFKGPVAGSVYFRQVIENEATLMYVNLFLVNDSATQREYFLAIHDKPVKSKFGENQCSDLGMLFNPFQITDLSNCKKTSHAGCPVGELKTKDGYINVTVATGDLSSTQVAYTDENLPVNGNKAVIGHSLALYHRNSPNKPMACANISEVFRRIAKVFFDADKDDGAFGYFQFTQASPFDETRVQIKMFNLSKRAEGYHVHQYPNPFYNHIKDNKKACSQAIAGDHLNPYGINSKTSPPNGTGTFDEYEIGDLSAKYTSFLNQNERQGNYTDRNLPMFGRYSIIGRPLVVHHPVKDGNKRWICANIELTEAMTVTFNAGSLSSLTKPTTKDQSLSIFNGSVIKGIILMTHVKVDLINGAPFDTEMYLDLVHVDGKESPDHNWHVHEKPVGEDAFSGKCMSTGPHYNPYGVYVQGNYKTTCTPNNPLRCELGDSSAKNAQYSLGSGPRFYTDVDTPLSGDFSVMNRSIVMHVKNGGAERQGCADVKRYNRPVPYAQGSDVTAMLYSQVASHVVLAIVAFIVFV